MLNGVSLVEKLFDGVEVPGAYSSLRRDRR
jgi:hypothetical protein